MIFQAEGYSITSSLLEWQLWCTPIYLWHEIMLTACQQHKQSPTLNDRPLQGVGLATHHDETRQKQTSYTARRCSTADKQASRRKYRRLADDIKIRPRTPSDPLQDHRELFAPSPNPCDNKTDQSKGCMGEQFNSKQIYGLDNATKEMLVAECFVRHTNVLVPWNWPTRVIIRNISPQLPLPWAGIKRFSSQNC